MEVHTACERRGPYPLLLPPLVNQVPIRCYVDNESSPVFEPAPIAQLVECPLRGTGGHGFDPGPRHTKVVKHGTKCSSLGTQTYGVELGLVDLVSG